MIEVDPLLLKILIKSERIGVFKEEGFLEGEKKGGNTKQRVLGKRKKRE